MDIEKGKSRVEEEEEEESARAAAMNDSVIELGQIALLGSSRPSIKHKKPTALELATSRRSMSISSRRRSVTSGASPSVVMMGSRKKLPTDVAAAVAAPVYEELVGPKISAEQEGDEVFEPPEEIQVTTVDLCYGYICLYKAYLISLVSVLLYCIASIMLRYSKSLTGSDHSFIRFITFIIHSLITQYFLLIFFAFLNPHHCYFRREIRQVNSIKAIDFNLSEDL